MKQVPTHLLCWCHKICSIFLMASLILINYLKLNQIIGDAYPWKSNDFYPIEVNIQSQARYLLSFISQWINWRTSIYSWLTKTQCYVFHWNTILHIHGDYEQNPYFCWCEVCKMYYYANESNMHLKKYKYRLNFLRRLTVVRSKVCPKIDFWIKRFIMR